MADLPYRVAEGLYQGAMRYVAERWSEIRGTVDVVLILAHEVEFIPAEYIGPWKIVFPIPDDPNGLDPDTWERLRDLVGWIAQAQRRVLTVCHMGENRSGLASALLLIERGCCPADAINLVRAAGPAHGGPHLLWNPGFEKQIREIADA